MNPIYIIGFMGAGKTTVGKSLANKLRCSVYDTDNLIELKEKKPISEIFDLLGERYFREIEAEVLKESKSLKGIVTTGGGIIVTKTNRYFLKESRNTVFLKCNPEISLERIRNDSTRPLTINKSDQDIIELYKERLPYYFASANIIIDSTNMTVEETVEEIAMRIK